MALTDFQCDVLRLIAAHRKRTESYIAGGVALNTLLSAPRISRDIDLFHDSEQALTASWTTDRNLILQAGYGLRVLRESPAFVEALVSSPGGQSVLMQWVRDSAYRFFPLIEHPILGLALHPFDLATNKVLALVGRLEPRDWIDVLQCDQQIQPLGYLVWAACGKDPGYNPEFLLNEARRSGRHTQVEIDELTFAGVKPDAHALGVRWHAMLKDADTICRLLPPGGVGRAVLDSEHHLCRTPVEALPQALAAGSLRFLEGSLRGVLPRIVERNSACFPGERTPTGQSGGSNT